MKIDRDSLEVLHGFGITLNNIRQRLSNRYGASAKVISQAEATGWLSEVRLPIERESS